MAKGFEEIGKDVWAKLVIMMSVVMTAASGLGMMTLQALRSAVLNLMTCSGNLAMKGIETASECVYKTARDASVTLKDEICGPNGKKKKHKSRHKPCYAHRGLYERDFGSRQRRPKAPPPLPRISYPPPEWSYISPPQPLWSEKPLSFSQCYDPLTDKSDTPQLPQQPDIPLPLPESSDKPQPETSDRRKPQPETSDRRQLQPETSDRRQPQPETSDRRQPQPETSDRRQPQPETSDRRQPQPETSDRRQPQPETSDRRQPQSQPKPAAPHWSLEPETEDDLLNQQQPDPKDKDKTQPPRVHPSESKTPLDTEESLTSVPSQRNLEDLEKILAGSETPPPKKKKKKCCRKKKKKKKEYGKIMSIAEPEKDSDKKGQKKKDRKT